MSEWVTPAEQWAAWTQVEAVSPPADALDAFDAEVAQRLESAGFSANLENTVVTNVVTREPDPSESQATLIRPAPSVEDVAESAVTQVHGAVPKEALEALEVSLSAPESGLEVGLDVGGEGSDGVDGLVLPSLTTAPEPAASDVSPEVTPPAPEPPGEPVQPEAAAGVLSPPPAETGGFDDFGGSGGTVVAPAPTAPVTGDTVIAPAPTAPPAVTGHTIVPTEPPPVAEELPPARTGSTLPPVPAEPTTEATPDPEGQAMSSGVFRTFDIHDDEEPEPPVARQKVVIGSPAPAPEDDTSELHADDLVEEEPEVEAPPPPPKEAAKPPPAPPKPEPEAAVAPPATPPAAPPATPAPTAPVTPPVAAPKQPAPAGAPKAPGWPEEVFADHFTAMARANHPKLAQQEVDFVVQVAGLQPGARVLDVGCGDGAHALALAQRGFSVTGVDVVPTQIARAEHAREMVGANVSFLQGDMRNLPVTGPFDAIVCLGTSFGYYDDEENRAVLRSMASLLAPGGRLMLHVFNRDHIIGRLPTRSWWQGQGCLVLDEAQMNFFTNRLAVHRTVVFEDGRQFEHRLQIRGYNAHELGRMCVEAGLRVVEISGSRLTRGRFYGASSADIWLLVEPKV